MRPYAPTRGKQGGNKDRACGSRARVPTTGLGGEARRRPVFLPVPTVSLHTPSKWMFQKHTRHNPRVLPKKA